MKFIRALRAYWRESREIARGIRKQIRLDASGETIPHIDGMSGFCLCDACVQVKRG